MTTRIMDPQRWEEMVQEAKGLGQNLLKELTSILQEWHRFLGDSLVVILDRHNVPLPCPSLNVTSAPSVRYRTPLMRNGQVFATILTTRPIELVVDTEIFRTMSLKLALILSDLNEWTETEAERRGEKLHLVMEYGMIPEVTALLALCGLRNNDPRVLLSFEMAMEMPFQHMEVLRRFVIARSWRYLPDFPWMAYQPDGIMILLPGTTVEKQTRRVEEWLRDWNRFWPTFPVRGYVLGMANLMNLPEALQTTQNMMQFAQQYGLSGVLNRSLNGHYVKILGQMTRESLESLVLSTLGPLLIDENHIVLETLREYLATGQSLAKTGRALYVHPNTVLYRIRQAEKLLNVKLKDTEQLTTIWMALQGHTLLSKGSP